MANIKIAQLTEQTTIADADKFVVETATSTNRMSFANLLNSIKVALGLNKNYSEYIYISGGSQVGFPVLEGASYLYTFATNTDGNHTQILVTRFPGYEMRYSVISQSTQSIAIATNAGKTAIYFTPTYSVRGFVQVSKV